MNQTPARIIRPSPPWRHLSISLLMRHKPSRPCRCCPAHSVAILSWTEAGAKIWGTIHLGDPQGASPSTAMQKLLQAPFSNARGIRNPDIELVTKTIHRANPAHQQPGAPPTKIPQDKTAPRNAINGHSSGFPGEVTNIIEAEPSITTTPGREVRRSSMTASFVGQILFLLLNLCGEVRHPRSQKLQRIWVGSEVHTQLE